MNDLPWLVRDALTLLLAFGAGVLSGSFSMGGQLLMKPGIRLLGATPLEAVGTTVPMILPTVATATATYHRQGLVDWTAVRWAAPLGTVGAVVGSLLASRVPGEGHVLQIATAALMLVTGLKMLTDARHREPSEPISDGAPTPVLISMPWTPARSAGFLVVGSVSGVLAGLLGVGGGVLMVPAFNQVLRMPLIVSIATSLVCAGIFAIPATITHALLGTINWRFAVLLIVGAVPGARLGARLAMRASDSRLELAVAMMVTLIAISYGIGELITLTS